MAQSGVILNVHHQLENILNNQHLIVQNQQDMFSKLSDIEKRLINVETCLILQQQQAALAFLEQQHQLESQQQQSTSGGSIPSLATPPSTSSSTKQPTQQHPTPPSTGSSASSQNVQSRSLTSPMTQQQQRTESKGASPVIGNNNTITNITNKHHHLNNHHHNNNNNNHHGIAASYKLAKHLKKKSLLTTNHKAHRLTNTFSNPFNGGSNGAGFHLSKLMSRYNFLKKTFKVAASSGRQQSESLPQQLFQLARPVERRLSASQQQKPTASSTPLSTSRHKTPQSKPASAMTSDEMAPHPALSTSASSPSLTTVQAQPVSQSMDYEESSEPQQQSLSGISTCKTEVELGQVGMGQAVDQQDETLSEEGSEDGEMKKPRRERNWEQQGASGAVDKTLSGGGGSSEEDDGDDDDETRDDMQTSTSSAAGGGGLEMLMDMKMEPNKGGLPSMMSLYSPSSTLISSKYTPLPGTSGSSGGAHRPSGSSHHTSPHHSHHHSSYLSSSASSSMVSSAELIACATDESTGQVLINEQDIRRTFAISKSRGNFAALLVQQLYNRQERISSNVMGTRGKRQLSPRRMIVVKRVTFKMYPSSNEKEEDLIWKKECVKAIDSKNRKIRVNPSPSTTSASLGATAGSNTGGGSSSMPSAPQSSSSTTTAMPSASIQQQQQQPHSPASLMGPGAHPSFFMGGRHPGLAGMSGTMTRPMLPSTFRPGGATFPPLPPLSSHGVPTGSGSHFPPPFNFNMLTSQISRAAAAFSASTGSSMSASPSLGVGNIPTTSSGAPFASTVASGGPTATTSSPSGSSPASTVAAMAAAMAAAAAAAVVNQQQQASSSTSQSLGHKATNTTPTKSSFHHHHMYQPPPLSISSSLSLLPPPPPPPQPIHQPQLSPISQTQEETLEEHQQSEETKESTRSRTSSDSPVPQRASQHSKTDNDDNEDNNSAQDQNSNSAVDNST